MPPQTPGHTAPSQAPLLKTTWPVVGSLLRHGGVDADAVVNGGVRDVHLIAVTGVQAEVLRVLSGSRADPALRDGDR